MRGDAFVLAQQAQQDMLGADVVVAEGARLFEGEFEHLFRARGGGELALGDDVGTALDHLLDFEADFLDVYVHIAQDVGGHAAAFLDEAEEDVFGADIVVVEALRLLTGIGHDLAGAVGEAVVVHAASPSLRRFSRAALRGARR